MSFLRELYTDIKYIPILCLHLAKALLLAGYFVLLLLVPIYIEIIYLLFFNGLVSVWNELITLIIISIIWTVFVFSKLNARCINFTEKIIGSRIIEEKIWKDYTIYMKVKTIVIYIIIIGFFILFLFFSPSLRHGLADNIECGDNGICIHYDWFINKSSNSIYNQWCDSKYQKWQWKLAYIEDVEVHNRFAGILSNSTTYIQPIFEDKKNYLPEDRLYEFNMNGWRMFFGKNVTYKSCIAR